MTENITGFVMRSLLSHQGHEEGHFHGDGHDHDHEDHLHNHDHPQHSAHVHNHVHKTLDGALNGSNISDAVAGVGFLDGTLTNMGATDEAQKLMVAKIVAPILLLFLTFLFGTSPILIIKRFAPGAHVGQTHDSKLLSFLVCVGGGVLFATSFLHVIPEVREAFGKQFDHFPITELVVCLGFLAVYLVEEVLHACIGHSSHANEDHGHSHSPQVIQCATNTEGASEPPTYQHFSHFEQMDHGHSHHVPTKVPSLTFGGVLIVVALSFHSVFEGLSLGLQSSASKTWLMLLAIALHKLVISFVLGFELCTSGVKKSAVLVYVTIFSIMSPIGACVGHLTQHHFEETIVVAVLNGIAAGTLLYVTFFEVLQKQKNSSLHGMLQLTAVLLGFFLMLTMELVLPHSHEDDHGHAHAH